MTNNWTDIGNATLVVSMGANPSENHPACMAHINRAKAGGNGHPAARMIVIDPRKTRTADQADMFVRIRPGTDIAFINGMMNYIMNNISGQERANLEAYLNEKSARSFLRDGNVASATVAIPNTSKYTDARIVVNPGRTDYVRGTNGQWTVGSSTVMSGVTRPTVLLDGATLKMWFKPTGTPSFLQYCFSLDNGLTWSTPVDTDVPASADAPFVFKYGSTFYMLNSDGGVDIRIYTATSETAFGTSSLLFARTSLTGLDKVDMPMLLADGTGWKLYMQGTPTAANTTRRLFAATATTTNPASWTSASFVAANAGASIMALGTAGFDAQRTMHPFVWKIGTQYFMTYTGLGLSTPDDVFQLGSATSTDGLTWVKGIKLSEFAADTTKANVVLIGSTYYTFATFDGAGTLQRATNWNPGARTVPVTNFPVYAQTFDAAGVDTVYNVLKAHVAPYDTATVAAICGCKPADITAVADEFIANSRCASYDPAAASTIIHNPKSGFYRSTTMLYAMGITQHTYGSQNVKAFAVIQTFLGNMGRCGGGINALRGIHNVQGSTDMGMLYGNTTAYNYAQMSTQTTGTGSDANAWGKYIDKLYGVKRLSGGTGGPGSYDDAYVAGNLGLQQRGWYNLMKAWFGPGLTSRAAIDAIQDRYPKGNGNNHIQMFRDMAALTTKAAVIWGQNPAVTEPNQGKVRAGLKALELLVVVDTFATETVMCDRAGTTYLIPACSYVEEAGSVTNSGRVLQWRERATLPKGNSKADLELLLRFAKKMSDGGVFSHIQAAWAGTALDSADVYNTLYGTPYGWVDTTGAFDSISLTGVDIWRGEDLLPTGTFATNTVTGSEAVAEKIFREYAGPQANGGTVWLYLEGYDNGFRPVAWAPTTAAPTKSDLGTNVTAGSITITPGTHAETTDYTVNLATGVITAVAGGNLIDAGSFTITYQRDATWQTSRGGGWTIYNRAKSRDTNDLGQTLTAAPAGYADLAAYNAVKDNNYLFKNWGYAWLVNRRVLYNNGDLPWDQADGFQGSEQCARLFVPNVDILVDYSTNYRHIHRLKDKPDTCLSAITAPHVVPGRFPAHTEPYETPREDLAAIWGRNTDGSVTTPVAGNLIMTGTKWVSSARPGDIPAGKTLDKALILTSIRCVEHFQGGPTTRNNPWNVEAEPIPWVEINSVDARANGIADGDFVNVITARGNSTTTQVALMPNGTYTRNVANPADNFGRGFKARVGVGVQSNQRVGAGVVAIPWHWGDQGLSTGARANDLCIDAMDANTTIPEYKACLCWIEKATV